MPLKLRPTGLGSGIDKDRPDYSGEWCIGRIYEVRGGPAAYKWFWSLTVAGPMTRSDRVATLDDATIMPSPPIARSGSATAPLQQPNHPSRYRLDARTIEQVAGIFQRAVDPRRTAVRSSPL